ncbi:tetratricopeptide repeat protein [Caballeronia zhejiangensis]|uniref:tetratricopeptide repeat-containing glycosyltransferase family protein n=1 Tax=Caballeronia zhejiangensis TaxID=871203 RepID=UPI00158C2905|nr:tetratricopeptide repeat protein [Caballeronia zhejiangensis]
MSEFNAVDECVAVSGGVPYLAIAHEKIDWIAQGNALLGESRFDEARTAYAVGMETDKVTVLNNIGFSFMKERRFEEAVPYLQTALKLDAQYVLARGNLCSALTQAGLAAMQQGAIEKAESWLYSALAADPNYGWALLNLGNIAQRRGQRDIATFWYHRAIAASPDYAQAHNNLAHLLLVQGDFEAGWAHYEWRWKTDDFPSEKRKFDAIAWRGENIGESSILVHGEQGFGDNIQFCRYVKYLRQRLPHATIYLEVYPELYPLLRDVDGPDAVFAKNGEPLPSFQYEIALMSLPRLLTPSVKDVPKEARYLSFPPEDNFADLAAVRRERPVIGLNWAGRPSHGNDGKRSLDLADLARFFDIEDVAFVSFQKGEKVRQIETFSDRAEILSLDERIRNFRDTAQALRHVDLLVTVDSANLHLAGALGVPTFALIAFQPDFRWMLERSDTIWYRSVKLFRQQQEGVWQTPIEECIRFAREFVGRADSWADD